MKWALDLAELSLDGRLGCVFSDWRLCASSGVTLAPVMGFLPIRLIVEPKTCSPGREIRDQSPPL